MKVFEEELELRIGTVVGERSLDEFTATLRLLRASGRSLDARRKSGQTQDR